MWASVRNPAHRDRAEACSIFPLVRARRDALGHRRGAQAHPYWVFPIAFAIAFSESFVGLSFLIPGTFLLITLGGVIGASHISLFRPGRAR